MEHNHNHLEQLREINAMMAKSSRFISLSGMSGVFAGTVALIGAFFAHRKIESYYHNDYTRGIAQPLELFFYLFTLAVIVFVLALVGAFFFTYQKSRKDKLPIWSQVSMRLLWNSLLPMVVGGIFILKLSSQNLYGFVAPACLMFYGLGLVNGSKYTLGEVRFLGYAILTLGIFNLFWVTHGLLFWALGFGVCHIVYGLIMWVKYERNT